MKSTGQTGTQSKLASSIKWKNLLVELHNWYVLSKFRCNTYICLVNCWCRLLFCWAFFMPHLRLMGNCSSLTSNLSAHIYASSCFLSCFWCHERAAAHMSCITKLGTKPRREALGTTAGVALLLSLRGICLGNSMRIICHTHTAWFYLNHVDTLCVRRTVRLLEINDTARCDFSSFETDQVESFE